MDRFAINTQFIGQHQLCYPVCQSTNAEAMRLLHDDPPPNGTVILTDHQTAGRGQRENRWESESGKNLTFSVVIYPELAVMRQFYLNIVTSLAVADTLLPVDNIKIKWPNDIVSANQKLCGILIQNNLRINKIQTSVIGIGINVNQTAFSYTNVTSLAIMRSKAVNREEMLSGILENLERRYLQLKQEELKVLEADYLQRMYWLNEVHRFADRSGEFQGEITGMDEDGQLIIQTAQSLQKYGIKEVKYLD